MRRDILAIGLGFFVVGGIVYLYIHSKIAELQTLYPRIVSDLNIAQNIRQLFAGYQLVEIFSIFLLSIGALLAIYGGLTTKTKKRVPEIEERMVKSVNFHQVEPEFQKDYCRYCGVDVSNDSIYCKICGKQLREL